MSLLVILGSHPSLGIRIVSLTLPSSAIPIGDVVLRCVIRIGFQVVASWPAVLLLRVIVRPEGFKLWRAAGSPVTGHESFSRDGECKPIVCSRFLLPTLALPISIGGQVHSC